MAGRLTEEQVAALLSEYGFTVKEMRLVKDDGEGRISHILCEKIST